MSARAATSRRSWVATATRRAGGPGRLDGPRDGGPGVPVLAESRFVAGAAPAAPAPGRRPRPAGAARRRRAGGGRSPRDGPDRAPPAGRRPEPARPGSAARGRRRSPADRPRPRRAPTGRRTPAPGAGRPSRSAPPARGSASPPGPARGHRPEPGGPGRGQIDGRMQSGEGRQQRRLPDAAGAGDGRDVSGGEGQAQRGQPVRYADGLAFEQHRIRTTPATASLGMPGRTARARPARAQPTAQGPATRAPRPPARPGDRRTASASRSAARRR